MATAPLQDSPRRASLALVRRLGILVRARLMGELDQRHLQRLVRHVYFTERRVPHAVGLGTPQGHS